LQLTGQNSSFKHADGHGIVLPEANFGTPSKAEDFEKMARRRFQNPKPKREGNWWYLRVWQDVFADGARTRTRNRIKLAPASISEREAKKIAAEMLRPLNQGLITVGSATEFREYVQTTYIPTVLPLMASTTQNRYQGVIRNYLEPTFGASCLRDLSPLTLQRYFSGMAKSELAHESIDKIRDVLSSILGSAVQYGLLVKNPVEGLRLPPNKTGNRNKPFIYPEQFTQLVDSISEPYATMVYVAVYTGLRVSELIGLKWRNVHADSITIDERYCRGNWGAPKSHASNATIGVNLMVIERIHRLKTMIVEVKAGLATRKYKIVKSSEPDDLVFQSVRTGAAMRDNNILARFIKPAARKLGLDFVNWRCLRTSHATWLKMAGADPKDIQGQMRHSRISTTMEIYTQFVPESQRRAVEKLGRLVKKSVPRTVPLLVQ
jgi:integrase